MNNEVVDEMRQLTYDLGSFKHSRHNFQRHFWHLDIKSDRNRFNCSFNESIFFRCDVAPVQKDSSVGSLVRWPARPLRIFSKRPPPAPSCVEYLNLFHCMRIRIGLKVYVRPSAGSSIHLSIYQSFYRAFFFSSQKPWFWLAISS